MFWPVCPADSSLILQPLDPDLPFNWVELEDPKGTETGKTRLLAANTGFMVFRNRWDALRTGSWP